MSTADDLSFNVEIEDCIYSDLNVLQLFCQRIVQCQT
jgi:hypothetical protein